MAVFEHPGDAALQGRRHRLLLDPAYKMGREGVVVAADRRGRRRIMHGDPVAPIRDQFGITEHLEVPRHGGLRLPQHVDELGHAKLVLQKHLHDPLPRRIGHRFEYGVGAHGSRSPIH